MSIGSLGAPSAFLLQNCERCVDQEIDGVMLGSWHLTFINHRGAQQDRIVLLNERSLLRVNVDFERCTVNHATRLPLEHIESVSVGRLKLEDSRAERLGSVMGGSCKVAAQSDVTALRLVMSAAFVKTSTRWLTLTRH